MAVFQDPHLFAEGGELGKHGSRLQAFQLTDEKEHLVRPQPTDGYLLAQNLFKELHGG